MHSANETLERVRQIITAAHPYPEGRWLFIPIEAEQDVQDVTALLAVKAACWR